MAVEFVHQRLAEAHDFGVAPTLGVEIGAAFAAADGQAGQRVFEGLFETEELHDPEVDRGVEAHAALVGAERGIELHAEGAVHVDLAGIVRPRHAEDDLALRFADPLDQRVVEMMRVPLDDGTEAFEHLADGLVEFRLVLVPADDVLEDLVEFWRRWASSGMAPVRRGALGERACGVAKGGNPPGRNRLRPLPEAGGVSCSAPGAPVFPSDPVGKERSWWARAF